MNKKEKMEKISSILIMVGIFFSIVIPVGGVGFSSLYSEKIITHEEVPCYDKNSNVIKDAVCYREYYDSDIDFKIYGLISLIFLGIGIVGIMLSLYTIRYL